MPLPRHESDASVGFCLFDTPVGPCGLAWGAAGITRIQLPEVTREATSARLAQRVVGAREAEPPPDVREAIAAILALLRGEECDLSFVTVDLASTPDFDRDVYQVARRIRPGEVATYGRIATELGDPAQARRVGQALGRNPVPIVVPCHRVLAAKGGLGGFSAEGGAGMKLRLLAIEKAERSADPCLFPGLPLAVAPRDPSAGFSDGAAGSPGCNPRRRRS